MQVSDKKREYWRRNLRLTAGLLALWFLVTYVMAYFAPELNQVQFLGFPFGFYMSAQGSLVIYVLIIAFYAWRMNRLDRTYGVHEE
jgi:putative solute:sodium symporter small subunit